MKYKINLRTKSKENITDRVIYFGLHYLRYILVVTQMVVICVFFLKFKVDQEIIDLKESVDQKREIIQISKPLVEEAKLIDYKISAVKKVIQEQNHTVSILNYLQTTFPVGLYFNQYIVENKNVFIKGESLDPNAIKLFYLKLKKEAMFKEVKLVSVKKEENGFIFSLELYDFAGT